MEEGEEIVIIAMLLPLNEKTRLSFDGARNKPPCRPVLTAAGFSG
jgi:hypothetical protein